ncbi:unnamed protein product [Dovyalis caffra]|uniref:RRM domain-containing protein n=1 Tax=Dovyalis caffra TaxID=77055 RepID=A0AAV1SD95_9ROSI|nr:unnamed protein product [Dovyalis caffra]
MDSDEGKLFIGGIAWDTTEETLSDYFNQYGEVSQVVIMRDKTTGRPRGFGFVVFSDPSLLDRVLQDKHTIDGRTVEAKRALSREEQHTSTRSGNFNSEDGFRQYFQSYGHVSDVVVMYDQQTQRPRGFGFITFDTEDAVDNVLQKTFHELNGKLVEVKRALPKDANPGGEGRGSSYRGYGSSGANINAADSRMDGNRYMQPQTSAGGYPPYSGYAAHSYGYGAANGGMGYYGTYGVGGYGGGNTAYGTGVYGMPGAAKNSWSSQAPSGYGASGYGANASYGAAASWGASGGGGSASAPMGQYPAGASGYGNQGYGYGNYSGSDGPYSSGYGAGGGRAGNALNGSGAGGESNKGVAVAMETVMVIQDMQMMPGGPDPLQVSGGYYGGHSR